MSRLCPNGHEVKDNLRFCPICGAELQEKTMKFCKKCGNERKGTEKFCSKCGTPFESVESPRQTQQYSPSYAETEDISNNQRYIIPIIIGVAILALIGGGWWFFKGSKSNEPFETALVSFKKTAPSDNFDVTAEINIDYPQKGNSKLKDNVIDFILKALKEDFTFEEHSLNPTYEGDKYNGQAVVDFYGEAKLKEFQKEGIGEVFFDVKKDAETEKFISYRLNMGGSAGGVGIGLSYGTSFNKTDGSIIQVIKDPNESSFKNFLISHVKSHLMKEGGAELLDESELKAHPYPKKAPYLSKDGICFIYQKYEIGAGAMGEVEFVVPYNKMQPYMSEEALSVVDAAEIEGQKEEFERGESISTEQEKQAKKDFIDEKTPTEEAEVVAFLNELYKDLESHPDKYQSHNQSQFSQYMVKSAMEKLLVESYYEEEGDPYFYDTEFFTDGMVSGGQHGDYMYPVSRDISKDEDHWYKIYTEFKDDIPAPTLIKVKVEKFGEKYMITDVQLNK